LRLFVFPCLGEVSMRSCLFLAALAATLLSAAHGAGTADPVSDCAQHIPWGAPTMTDGASTDLVCHKGYLSALDKHAKLPRWVAYDLTGPHTLGCYARTGLQFKTDPGAPTADQASLSDYRRSGYDLGHMAPNQDFAWSKSEQKETFSFANVSPQLPGLNRQGWERGEEMVRAWALKRGDVEVYVGPIVGDHDGIIGDDAVDVPTAFYKVVIDRHTGEAVGFVMPQRNVAKGFLEPYRTSLADIAQRAHVSLPLPDHTLEAGAIWPADLAAWKRAHQRMCRKKTAQAKP
jgi:endonuclease G